METKPYSLQSPEQIAKDYGGNKQKIAEAMQMGVLDPTAGMLAAMFIDRMRNAAQTEAAPQQTVAQQVFAPPQPQMPQGMPAGLGATPEAAAMPAPAEAMMGAPSAQAVPGMAEGGMVPPYASGGGLSDLPVPDGMFDEPSNGGFNDGYRGGGLVAFGTGDKVVAKPSQTDDEDETITEDYQFTGAPGVVDETGAINVTGPTKKPKLSPVTKAGVAYQAPANYFGDLKDTVYGNLDVLGDAAKRETEEAKRYREYLNRMLDPEEQKKRRQEDMWAAIGQIGARMAQTPGSLIQAASAGVSEALPGITAAAKERRGEERAAQQARVAEERTGNKELMDRANVAIGMLNSRNDLNKAFQDNNFKNELERLGIDAEVLKARIMAGAGIRQSVISAMSQQVVGGMEFRARKAAAYDNVFTDLLKNAPLDPEYQKRFKVNPNAANAYLRDQAAREVARQFGAGAVDLGDY